MELLSSSIIEESFSSVYTAPVHLLISMSSSDSPRVYAAHFAWIVREMCFARLTLGGQEGSPVFFFALASLSNFLRRDSKSLTGRQLPSAHLLNLLATSLQLFV